MLQWKNTLADLTTAYQSYDRDAIIGSKIALKIIKPPRLLIEYSDDPTFQQITMNLFSDSLAYLLVVNEDDEFLEASQIDYINFIRDLLGSDSPALSDLYMFMSRGYLEMSDLHKALDYCGKALLIRIRSTGMVSLRTAESHYQLGLVYFHANNSDEAAREIFAARIVYQKLAANNSNINSPSSINYDMYLADCDELLAHVEWSLQNSYAKGYLLYLRAYRCRCRLLGIDNPLTVTSLGYVTQAREMTNHHFFTREEVIDRLDELGWLSITDQQQPSTQHHPTVVGVHGNTIVSSIHQVLSLYLSRLSSEEVYTPEAILAIIHRAKEFYLDNEREQQRRTYTASSPTVHQQPLQLTDDRDEDRDDVVKISDSMPPSLTAGTDLPSDEELLHALLVHSSIPRPGGQQEQQTVVFAASPSSQQQHHHQQAVEEVKEDQHTTAAIEGERRGEGAFRIPQTAIAAGHAVPATPPPAAITPTLTPVTIKTTASATIGASSPSASPGGSAAAGNRRVSFFGDSGDSSGNRSAPNSAASGQQQKGRSPSMLSTTSPSPSPTKKNKNKAGGWKPVTLDSPLRLAALQRHDSHHAVQMKPIVIHHSIPIQQHHHHHHGGGHTNNNSLVRSDTGELFLLSSLTPRTLQLHYRSRLVGFALLAWLSSGHSSLTTLLGGDLKVPSKRDLSINSAISAQRAVNKRKSTMLSTISHHSTAASATGNSSNNNANDPRKALNALFGKNNPTAAGPTAGSSSPLPPMMTATAGTGIAAAMGSHGYPIDIAAIPKPTGDAGQRLPMPPPLPTSWPPVPYEGPDALLANHSEGGGLGDLFGGGAAGTGTVSNDPRPKLKQIHLVDLPSLEGTFWMDDLPAAGTAATGGGRSTPDSLFLKPEMLFEDILEEFVIGGPKTKKGLAGGGPGAGGAAVGKGRAAGAAGNVPESILDPQRAQNIQIMLAKLGKKSLDNIAEYIQQFEASILGIGVVSALMQFIPTADEVKKVQKFVEDKVNRANNEDKKVATATKPADEEPAKQVEGEKGKEGQEEEGKKTPPPPPVATAAASSSSASAKVVKVTSKMMQATKIGKAEQYIYLMNHVQKLEKKLSGMSCVLSAAELHQYVVTNAEILINACSEVVGSSRIKFILKAMLALNNALVSKSRPTPATTVQGFPLSSWSKLQQVKCNSGETAHQYLVQKLLQHFPEALELSHDLPTIDEAKGVLLARMTANVSRLEESLLLLEELRDEEPEEDEEENKTKDEEKYKNSKDKDEEKGSGSGSGSRAGSRKNSHSHSHTNLAATVLKNKAKSNLSKAYDDMAKLYHDAKQKYVLAASDFQDLCQLYGEVSPPADPELVFGEIANLCKSLQAAVTAASGKLRRKAVMMGMGAGGGGGH